MTTPPGHRGITIEVLYFDGCPNHQALVAHLRELLDGAGVDAEIELRRIGSEEQAQRLRFLGSPTVRVQGRDVEPDAEARSDYGLGCRLYRTAGGIAGAPPDALILAALAAKPSAERSPDVLTGRPLERRLDGLPPAFRRFHGRVLSCFLTQGPADVEELRRSAQEPSVRVDEALAELERRDVLRLDAKRDFVAVAYPFSAAKTAHQVHLPMSDRRVFAMCALDALGVPFLARETATVISTDAATGGAIEVWVDPAGRRDWNPQGAVVVAAVSGDGPSATCCCPYVNFIGTRERAPALLEQLAAWEGGILEMDEAIALGSRIFGGLLRDADLERLGRLAHRSSRARRP